MPAKLFDVGVGAGVLVRRDGLDLALAENAALRVDLLGGQDVALERGLAEHRGGAGEEGHVADLERRGGNISLGRRADIRHGRSHRRHRSCRGRPYRDSKIIQEISAVQLLLRHGPSSLSRVGCDAPAKRGAYTSGLFVAYYNILAPRDLRVNQLPPIPSAIGCPSKSVGKVRVCGQRSCGQRIAPTIGGCRLFRPFANN